MQIKDMFRKKIDREIQGVIIVGQGEETNVAQELEEYVVTRELQRHFADFFAAYKKGIQGTTPKMGVWISGFFGSGKSHFLKILSYLLQNKQVGDKHAIDYFIEDQKITNQMVLADMQLAANTPSDVILFNIDSKSDSNGKENKDAIVNVFLKVFNEMQGFCGSMPHLADLERRLSEEGRFEEFKEKFEEEYGDPWESSRQDFDFIQDSVVDVLSDMDFMSESAARNWCEKATESYQISIEDFAKRVKSYIDKKGNNHHVVFLVDEIGQYIGDDSKLMLNLQTVTEELGKECMGKAWVIVTSQQDIDSITKVKGNDFSKIQGRFDTRLSLSSANVDAVIKKRILDKTETAAQSLRLLYDQKATIIKNLIVFNDGVEKKLYANAEDFAEVYPFVPYQFNLLASVLTSIRTHGASGKHLSEGERSMLALFKESAMQLMDDEMGAIVPFYRFYDALENFLDHSHSSVIIRAYDNSYSSFRYSPIGMLYNNKGPILGHRQSESNFYVLGYLNSKVAEYILQILSPTLGFESGYVSNLPYAADTESNAMIFNIVESCIGESKMDWDSFETSWDFKKHPLFRDVSTISEAFTQWQSECDNRFNQLKANEEELNRIFIDIYGLQDELTPEVEDKDVTVRKADLQRDIKSLLSYAVGCMFGRYSTYKDGLLFAGEPYSLQAFVDKLNERPGTISAEELQRAYRNEGVVVDEMFFPDEDNVIPITDEEYLDDDIVSRLCAWLKAVYGADTLEANLDYIAKALGNKGSTSREIIRNYFLNDFFKDHCQTYSVTGSGKRPIYWLFDSGKQNGFKALVYLHRYTPDTIGNLRIDYLHKMQRVYESEINRMQDMMDHSGNAREVAAASKRKDKLAKQLKECREYDEKISHLALSRIELDLDDGVKVNYRKLQTAQDGKFYEVLADSKNIMVKEKK